MCSFGMRLCANASDTTVGGGMLTPMHTAPRDMLIDTQPIT